MRRIPHRSVTSIDEVARIVGDEGGPVTLLFDADGTIVPQGADDKEFASRVETIMHRFAALPRVSRVVVISNGPERGAGVIARVNKPWTTRRRLGLTRPRDPVWVIGDQIASDGLLAWRIGGRFIQLAISIDDEPAAQATLRRRGRVLAPLILKPWS